MRQKLPAKVISALPTSYIRTNLKLRVIYITSNVNKFLTIPYRYMSAWLLSTIFHFHDFHGIRGRKPALPAILCLDGSIRKHYYLPKNWQS